mmetsp:Transcript_108972/g.307121  ORF Transcript_108972/g.307121 Transcript_108972/m.307121 type:complete len:293 (-) Transcript_108972:318-1196(-)
MVHNWLRRCAEHALRATRRRLIHNIALRSILLRLECPAALRSVRCRLEWPNADDCGGGGGHGVHIAQIREELGKRQWAERRTALGQGTTRHGGALTACALQAGGERCNSARRAIVASLPASQSTGVRIFRDLLRGRARNRSVEFLPSGRALSGHTEVLHAMGMIAAVALQATPPLEKVAHLRFVDAICDPQFGLAMGEDAILTIYAMPVLRPGLTQLRLLQVRLCSQFVGRVSVATALARTFPALKEVAHLRFFEPRGDSIVVGLPDQLRDALRGIAGRCRAGATSKCGCGG